MCIRQYVPYREGARRVPGDSFPPPFLITIKSMISQEQSGRKEFNSISQINEMPRSSYLQKRALGYKIANTQARKKVLEASRPLKQFVERAVARYQEKKALQVFSSQAILTSSSSTLLNGIAEGDSVNNRDGRLILLKSLDISVMVASGGTPTSNCYGTWFVVYDRQTNGANISYTEVYDTSTITDPALAHRNPAFYERFKVLCREDFGIQGETGIDSPQPLTWRKHIDLTKVLDEKDQRVRYSGTGGTITSIATGSIYLFWAASNQTNYTGATDWSITYGSKLNFTDS